MHRITLTADKTLQKKFIRVTETKNNDTGDEKLKKPEEALATVRHLRVSLMYVEIPDESGGR